MGQARLLNARQGVIALPEEVPDIDPRRFFPEPVAAVWLEIGFGGGEHLAHQAMAHPGIGFIGCEVFENGVVKLLAEIERQGMANLRVLIDDARPFLERLTKASLERVFILFPDPWPKERHKKRRLVSRPTLDALARAMRAGAELRLASDDPDYFAAMMTLIETHPDFVLEAEGKGDWAERPADWPMTRYERKALAAGRVPAFLRCRRFPP
ncbi:MAG TPA: tRNA (guanosine(46)-N7)-methyltransferase TrmB [Stellaceae bacterium]|nr:tRNA (guanosine(46)-N7)-methyltransferase TrmB [Stellaceae bacterium]